MLKKVPIVVLPIVLLQTLCFYYWVQNSNRKVVYADTIRLVNAYKFKIDLEQSANATLQKLKGELDSVSVMYKVDTLNQRLIDLVLMKQKALSEGYNVINKDINEQVWERLNPVLQKFGKERNIEILMGANGMGTILYGTTSRDVTEDLIKFVNTDYERGQ